MGADNRAFIDARCRKCGAHIGWFGLVTDHPPCPRCGAEPNRERLNADQQKINDFQELLREMKQKNPGWEKWQRARVAAGLTLRQAAELLGITPSLLSAYENCREVPPQGEADAMAMLYSGGTVE